MGMRYPCPPPSLPWLSASLGLEGLPVNTCGGCWNPASDAHGPAQPTPTHGPAQTLEDPAPGRHRPSWPQGQRGSVPHHQHHRSTGGRREPCDPLNTHPQDQLAPEKAHSHQVKKPPLSPCPTASRPGADHAWLLPNPILGRQICKSPEEKHLSEAVERVEVATESSSCKGILGFSFLAVSLMDEGRMLGLRPTAGGGARAGTLCVCLYKSAEWLGANS